MAKVFTWTGNQDSNWNNAQNWLPNDGIPTIGNDFFSDTTVVFGSGAVVTGGSANFFVVGGSTAFNGAFLANGQSAKDSGQLFVVNYTAFQIYDGTATFAGPSSSLTTHANVLVGYHDIGSPAAGGARLDFLAGAHALLNTNNVIDVNGIRISENSLHVGDNEDGIVNILGTGTEVVTDSGIAIGVSAGVHGTMHVGDHASLHVGFVSATQGFYVGYGGSGSLLIDGAAQVRGDGFADIGTGPGSVGDAIVDGAGTDWHQAGTIAVGFFPGSQGTLTVRHGATVETDTSFRLGAGGTVVIESGGSVTSTGLSGVAGRVTVDAGANLLLHDGSISATSTAFGEALGGIQVAAGGRISGTGLLTGSYIQNDGTIDANSLVQGAKLIVNALNGPIHDPGTPGILSISGNATLELKGGVADDQTVVFNHTSTSGGHETLIIDGPLSSFNGAIKGLAANDVVDLAGVSGATTWSFNSTTDVLTVSDASGVRLGALRLVGDYSSSASFGLTSDGHGGVLITESSVARAPTITSGGGGNASEYVLNPGKQVITTVQASGTDVHYFIQDAKTGKLVTSTSQFTIDTNTGVLSYVGREKDATLNVTVVSKNSVGQDSQKLTVDVEDDHVLFGRASVPDTFVFHAGFGNDAVFGFRVADSAVCGQVISHDVLQLDHTLFTGAVAGESGDALVALLDSHTNSLGRFGSVITTDSGEHIYLADVSKQALLTHASADFHFV